jgi:curved DNA-binding protein CbpA
LKTYYELLGVDPATSADDIKRAFRREIARYHPDKVQHLGPEFQDIAATRASELTEAYRVLMDPEARENYDAGLAERPPAPDARPPAPAPQASRRRPDRGGTPVPESVRQARETISDFVKKATLARLRLAIEAVEAASPFAVTGFDAAYAMKPKGGLFKKSEPPVRLLARLVPQVDGAAVQEAWPMALKAATPGSTLCLLLMGSGLAPAGELSSAVAELRRKTRTPGPLLVPVDFRDWEALFPPDTPALVRSVIQKLKQEK